MTRECRSFSRCYVKSCNTHVIFHSWISVLEQERIIRERKAREEVFKVLQGDSFILLTAWTGDTKCKGFWHLKWAKPSDLSSFALLELRAEKAKKEERERKEKEAEKDKKTDEEEEKVTKEKAKKEKPVKDIRVLLRPKGRDSTPELVKHCTSMCTEI